MSIKLLAVALAALLTSCGGGGSSSMSLPAEMSTAEAATTPPPAAPVSTIARNPGCYVVIYGDSILASGAPWLTEYPADIIRRLRPAWTVDDRAVAGQTGLTGATNDIDDPRPPGAAVVVGWGMNDLILDDIFTPQLDAFIKKIKAEGSAVVVTGIIQHTLIPNYVIYDEALRDTAVADGAAYADFGSVPITTVDGVHPNQDGTDLLMEDLVNTLDKECNAQ